MAEKTPRERMDEVLAEDDRYEAFDSEFRPNPYNPWVLVPTLATEDAVPYLIEMVEGSDDRRRRWSIQAMEQLGAKAGPAAAAALERRGEGPALFRVDEARARELGFATRRETRAAIAEALRQEDPARALHHLAEMFGNPDPAVVLFALGAGGYGDDSGMEVLLKLAPEALPLPAVRALLGHEDPRVQGAAVRVLTTLHLPEDAELVLHWALESAVGDLTADVTRSIDWLGALPGSDALIPRLASLRHVYEVVRRRRCAGLANDAAALRPRLHAALIAPPRADPGFGPSRRDVEMEYAALIVMELSDVNLAYSTARAAADPPSSVSGGDALIAALDSLGEAGREAVNKAMLVETGRARRLGEVMTQLRNRAAHPWFPSLRSADQRFSAGELEDTTLVESRAFGIYADVLRRQPDCAYAAYQLAWIDRGFGTPIGEARIAWLHSLGVRDHLLQGLAPPEATVHGFRFSQSDTYDNQRIPCAQRAAKAGLHPLAARFWTAAKREQEAALARDATAGHLELVRRGCPPVDGSFEDEPAGGNLTG